MKGGVLFCTYLVVLADVVVFLHFEQLSLAVVPRKEEEQPQCHLVVVCCTVALGLTEGKIVDFLAVHLYLEVSG